MIDIKLISCIKEIMFRYDIDNLSLSKIINKHNYKSIEEINYNDYYESVFICTECRCMLRIGIDKIYCPTYAIFVCDVVAGLTPYKHNFRYHKNYLSCNDVIIKNIIE